MSVNNERQFNCPNCGQSHSYEDDPKVFGSAGCASCGRTRPYLARPSGGRIVTGTKGGGAAYWMGQNAEFTTVRKEGKSHKAAAVDRSGMYVHGEGRTGQDVVNNVMGQLARQEDRKWWPTTHAWHKEVDAGNKEING
jgi:hypothetical protein